jgi:hypothetical protein
MNTLKNALGHKRLKYIILAVMVASLASVSFAQTPVQLDVDIDELFTQTNNWMATLWPIFAIGGAIAIASALITMVIGRVVAAFKQN